MYIPVSLLLAWQPYSARTYIQHTYIHCFLLARTHTYIHTQTWTSVSCMLTGPLTHPVYVHDTHIYGHRYVHINLYIYTHIPQFPVWWHGHKCICRRHLVGSSHAGEHIICMYVCISAPVCKYVYRRLYVRMYIEHIICTYVCISRPQDLQVRICMHVCMHACCGFKLHQERESVCECVRVCNFDGRMCM
jgi:hypothetical protein